MYTIAEHLEKHAYLTKRGIAPYEAVYTVNDVQLLIAEAWDEGWSAAGAWEIAAPGTSYPWNPYKNGGTL